MVSNLVLFGKHPAWSDHMFISDDTSVSHYLKRVFYDHSVIPALQGGKGDQRISETWCFLVFIGENAFFIVNAISRDSVGRRRFPLIAAYPLPPKLKLEAALDELRELKKELLSLLDEMLESPDEDLNQLQEAVTQKAKSFKSKVDWSSVDSSKVRCELKQDAVASLMSRLSNDHDALGLKSCSFLEACSFIQFGLKQFKSAPPAMLVLDQEDKGLGLFFAMEGGSSFHLKHLLYGNLTPLNVSDDNIPSKVSRLLKSAVADSESVLSVDEVPSLKLGANQGPVSRKFIIFSISFALIFSVLFGLFYSCSGTPENEVGISETKSIELSAREKWTLNATAYVEWIQPLITFVDEQSTPIAGFDPVTEALEAELDPFSVVEAEGDSIKLAKNPPDQFFNPENTAKLDAVYTSIDQLRSSVTAYYERQFSNELLKELKRQNYQKPSFIDVDFSQQPLLPSFGPELINQLESYENNRSVLSELVLSTKALWNSIIKPLHQLCPEHAKYIQRYVQNLITESESLEQFQNSYTALLEIFGYPEFIQLDAVKISELSEDDDWLHLLEQEKSVESLHKLVELLEANQKNESESQPVDTIEQPVDIIKSPMGAIKLPMDAIKQPVNVIEQPVNVIEQPVNVIEQPVNVIEQPVNVIEQSTDVIEQSLSKQTLRLDSDLAEWDFFLEARLKQLQGSPFSADIKGHAEAIRLQILEDTTLESSQAIQEIKEQTTELVAAFQRLNVDSIKDASGLHSAYLENEQNLKHMSDYMFAEYAAAKIAAGDLESVNKVSQEISLKVDTSLASLNKSFADLKTDFFSSQVSGAEAGLSGQINEIAKNPLYFEGVLGSQLEIIKTAVSGNPVVVETAQDLIWYSDSLTSNGGTTGTQLAVIVEVFNNLDPANHTSELNNSIQLAFDQHVRNLRATSYQDLLNFYEDLAIHLPQELQTPRDSALKQIATYWSRFNLDPNLVTPAREELEKLRDSTELPLNKQFYAGLLAGYNKVNLESSDTTLDEIRKMSGVESVSVSDDQPRVEIIFEGNSGKLVFLPVETGNGAVLVQQSPLSLQQYIQLSNICDFDTEYYLTLQDSFWPRSFEVGIGSGFSILRQWQFRNKDVFASIDAFNKNTLPAHLNEPDEVLLMADFFGFRLLRPEECAAFIRLADSSSGNRLEFSAVDKENLERSKTIQSSVYGESIVELIEQGAWSGGIDFARSAPGENQFFDVVGGSAELAYDGTNFYVCGGSWLHAPTLLEKPVQITEPQRMYIDIGIRFAMDAPTQSFSKLVQKVALQVLAESE
ncbi:MAG: hypothetical protein ACJAT5_000086 [Lentimonas sp.]|jgi:hypothetical protein